MKRCIVSLVSCLILAMGVVGAEEAEQQSKVNKEANPMVLIETSLGDITLELYPDKAPESVKNFLQYVDDSFFDNTIFHRVIGNFMIQGGGFTTDFQQKATRAPIVNEASNGLKNKTGTIAMARTANPNSATSQFFINVADNAGLDHPGQDGHGYAVFGKVADGMDVVSRIKAVSTGTRSGMRDVPTDDVVMTRVSRKAPAD